MTIREQTQKIQRETLSQYACLSDHSRGREYSQEECPIRTCFARDRDRIIHCKSFRRLMHKTQVFLSPEGDHYRTRLTHTLEVNQIAKTLAVALRLNEELTEAIALGHDLGHTPFGHAGERALRDVCPHGFRHSEQSVRVVEKIENDGRGLNLTWEVRNGIGCHSYSNPSPEGKAKTWEGQIVYFADKIAYLNHDIDDALRGEILQEEDIPWEIKYSLGRTKSQRITTLIKSIIDSSKTQVMMDDQAARAFDQLNSFMYEAVYRNPVAKSEEGKAIGVVKSLYEYYVQHPQEMPQEYRRIIETSDVPRAVCDYISGMSDRFAVTTYERLYVPRSWGY
ncbi:deoxyguanosinetriphosphate triphosphohydrolase [Youxingia wuxianensis]|uniref:Deoxyguanosinetriphosphate triphosphohydrolase n=1 Tax=Youxingia wuxianensis TaxID=2763678 RepID=A0A926ELC3_9FIRM|nr:deoxyguanosinetriphosphate triphosphohydrolase [Youxingia wuxianensis]MBC8584495.1 deoxyguanosinetriphosphate triphosphohydrolase [Youxingia wuxianensis]